MSVQPQQVVIIGGGFGGLNAAKILGKNKHFRTILLDKTNHHLFQPLLYQVATAALSPGDIAMPIREIFRDLPYIQTLMAEVVAIDKEKQQVLLSDGDRIGFDYLIVAPGSRHAYFAHPEWESLAPGLKTLKDALLIRERILSAFEMAERTPNKDLVPALLSFVVIGAGPTGVEMAGAIAEIAHQSLRKNFRAIDPSHSKIYLVESGNQILNGYPPKLANRGQKDLEKKGITVCLNSRVTKITPEGVFLGEQFYPAHNIIWAAGNTAAPILKTLNVPLDKQGRVIITPDLSIPEHANIYVIGDAACCQGPKGFLPAVAPVAVQQGRYVAKRIISKSKKPYPPFKYSDKGMMASIGKYDALVLSGPFKSSGFFAWIAWSLVHIYFLIGFRTKLFVFIQWIFYFFRGQRNVRLIANPLDKNKTL